MPSSNKTFEELQQDYQDMLNSLEAKDNKPNWFNSIFKNILTKTISLEEWNMFMRYVENNSSDIETVVQFSKDVYAYLDSVNTLAGKVGYIELSGDPGSITNAQFNEALKEHCIIRLIHSGSLSSRYYYKNSVTSDGSSVLFIALDLRHTVSSGECRIYQDQISLMSPNHSLYPLTWRTSSSQAIAANCILKKYVITVKYTDPNTSEYWKVDFTAIDVSGYTIDSVATLRNFLLDHCGTAKPIACTANGVPASVYGLNAAGKVGLDIPTVLQSSGQYYLGVTNHVIDDTNTIVETIIDSFYKS